jgi:hypothetical protein
MNRLARFLMKIYYVVTVPVAIFFILESALIHPSYRLTFFKKLSLGLNANAGAYTRKDMSGVWTYYPAGSAIGS